MADALANDMLPMEIDAPASTIALAIRIEVAIWALGRIAPELFVDLDGIGGLWALMAVVRTAWKDIRGHNDDPLESTAPDLTATVAEVQQGVAASIVVDKNQQCPAN